MIPMRNPSVLYTGHFELFCPSQRFLKHAGLRLCLWGRGAMRWQ